MRLFLFLLLLLPLVSQAFTLKISTLYPNGTGPVKALKKAGKTIAQQTDGRVKLHVYAGGVMGDDKSVLRKIRVGQLHGMMAQGGALAHFYRDSQVYNLPMAFRSYDEVRYVRKHLDSVLQEGFAEHGWVTFGFVSGGFAYLMTQHPVKSVAQMQKQKIWLPANDTGSAAAAKAFNLSPVRLPISGVLTSLQTGAINALVAPPKAALTLQWFTKLDYVTKIPLLYTYGMLAVSKRWYHRIKPADQKIVEKVLEKTFAQIDNNSRKDNQKAFDALLNQGLQTVTPGDKQLAVWRHYANKADAALAEDGQVSLDMQKQLKTLLDTYRAAD